MKPKEIKLKSQVADEYPIPDNLKYLLELFPEQRILEAFNASEEDLQANAVGKFTSSQRIRTYAAPVMLALVLIAIGLMPVIVYLSGGEMDLFIGGGLILMMGTLAGFILFPVFKGLQAQIHHAEGMVQPRVVNTQLNHNQSVTGYIVEIEGEAYATTKKQYYGFIPSHIYKINYAPMGVGGARGQIISAIHMNSDDA